MSRFAVTFINVVGEVVTRPITADNEKEATKLVEQFGYTVKSCIKII